MKRIIKAKVHSFSVPLKKPYILSFTTIREFRSVVIEIALNDGGLGMGEAVALPGYGKETFQDILKGVKAVVRNLEGCSLSRARAFAQKKLGPGAFATSAVLSALDLACADDPLPDRLKIPLAGAVSISEPKKMTAEVSRLLKKGYTTIKVKIGRDLAADMRSAHICLSEFSKKASFRFDANQAYDYKKAKEFLASLNIPGKECVESVEQPLPVAQWANMEKLAGISPVPLMLDESIYTPADIQRAAKIGVKFVKLKLVKHAGISDVVSLAKEARRRGIGVVIGNGVATDIGGMAEAIVYAGYGRLFNGPSEGNGFAKLSRTLLANPPKEEKGFLIWQRKSDRHKLWEIRRENHYS